ncbi:hypothetical protein GCM10023238_38340 [Streptomyces heliomycini]
MAIAKELERAQNQNGHKDSSGAFPAMRRNVPAGRDADGHDVTASDARGVPEPYHQFPSG